MSPGLHVHIGLGYRTYDVYIIEERMGQEYVAKVGDDGFLEFSLHERNLPATPTFRLTNDMAEGLLKALHQVRVPSPEQGFVAGELQATKAHLEDMRELLKLSRKAGP